MRRESLKEFEWMNSQTWIAKSHSISRRENSQSISRRHPAFHLQKYIVKASGPSLTEVYREGIQPFTYRSISRRHPVFHLQNISWRHLAFQAPSISRSHLAFQEASIHGSISRKLVDISRREHLPPFRRILATGGRCIFKCPPDVTHRNSSVRMT